MQNSTLTDYVEKWGSEILKLSVLLLLISLQPTLDGGWFQDVFTVTDEFWHQNVACSGTGDAVPCVNSFYYDFTSHHYNFFYNVRSSLPGWFFILIGPLIAGFLVAALIWFLWSAPDVASLIGSFDLLLWRCVSDRLLWSPDLASLIGSFELLWRFVSDLLLWSPYLTLRIWSAHLISWPCVSDRLLWSLTLRLWSAPLISLRCVSDRFLW
jgi:hypothetical protein